MLENTASDGWLIGSITLPVYLTMPLCEEHSPKPRPEDKEEKDNWFYLVGLILLIGLGYILTVQVRRLPFFAAKDLMWSVVLVITVLILAILAVIWLVEWI